MPSFLQPYYSSVLSIPGEALAAPVERQQGAVSEAFYATASQTWTLAIQAVPCDSPRCDAVMDRLRLHAVSMMGQGTGSFVKLAATEFFAEADVEGKYLAMHVFLLPASVQIWTYETGAAGARIEGSRFDATLDAVNHQRYDEALAEGNIAMGRWGGAVRDYARRLLENGRKEEGLEVLRKMLATSPYDYAAHLDYMRNALDRAAAAESAKVVFRDAESAEQIDQAAKFLDIPVKRLDSYPVLDKGETGLQVILIPLPPINAWLLEETAATFEKITAVPVKIRRLDAAWKWGTPERIPFERDVQRFLLGTQQKNIDFTGWNMERYVAALEAVKASTDVLSATVIDELLKRLRSAPGQYNVGPYVDRLADLLKGVRSKDPRTMYVGITETDIYNGDNNYVFSVSYNGGPKASGIMSYHRMLAATLHESHGDRQRLVERIAKEMVPASLKQLDIPRSVDPKCPYSYANSVQRLDEKTLNLSDPVKQALIAVKDPAWKQGGQAAAKSE